MKIHSLFPIPLYDNDLPRSLSKDEIDYILECEKFYVPNTGNTTSCNTNVLDEKPLIDIKNFILFCLSQYMNQIVMPKVNVNIRITQSWFNYSKPGQFHHKHAHPNSFVSGVMYFNADPAEDKIMFYNPRTMYNLRVPTWNLHDFNAESMWMSINTGKLFIFPSTLEHSVSSTTSTETRISLAFNTFLEGEIGDDISLTGLRI